jgi:hypothetical protein
MLEIFKGLLFHHNKKYFLYRFGTGTKELFFLYICFVIQSTFKMENHSQKIAGRVKLLLTLFIAGLVLSGLSAIPIVWQLDIALEFLDERSFDTELVNWLKLAKDGVTKTNDHYPFIAYGTDWLAFAHFMIAIVFIGPLRDPVRNIWVIQFGLIACAAVFPMALIAGHIRGIPVFHQIIDCLFGLFGGILLGYCYKKIKTLEQLRLKINQIP